MAERLRAVGVPVVLRIPPGPRHATAYARDVWGDTVSFLARYVGEPG